MLRWCEIPRFAVEVGNVVIDSGGAGAQPIVDRYLSGESVPYTDLRRVWMDTVGWVPPPNALGYMNLLAQVRK